MKTISIALLLTFLAGCSSSLELTSHWKNTNQDPERDSTMYIKDQNIVVGIQNDDEYLYLTVDISDRMKQRQIVFQGLTTWFDYQGGDARRFGIHYPAAMDRPPFERRRQDASGTPDTSMVLPEKFPDEIEILGPMEGEHKRLQIAETKGIEVSIVSRNGTMIYALKVPLMDNGQHLYGIGTRPGTSISLGIETGTFMMGGRGGGGGMGSGEPSGGGMGGRRGFGGGRGRGGMAPGGVGGTREPIKFWAKVQLAQK